MRSVRKSSAIFLLVLTGCGEIRPLLELKFSQESKETVTDLSELEDKARQYVSLEREGKEEGAFILEDTCDSALFSGLYSAARPDLNIDLTRLRTAPGTWQRRPSADCDPYKGTSRSTISRDMMVGIMWWMWRTNQLVLAEELREVLDNYDQMLPGTGTIGELRFTPALNGTLNLLIDRLRGREAGNKLVPISLSANDVPTGFLAHVRTWHILLRAEIEGSIHVVDKAVISKLAKREPNNPLFQAAYHRFLDGNYDSVLKLLLDPREWPVDRLPSTLEHCDPWPIQRAFAAKDWDPCLPAAVHTGAELPVILELILKGH